jgi:hypothetical protein
VDFLKLTAKTLDLPMFRIELSLKRLCAVVLILLIQGPAMFVQEVAWAKMLVSYSIERGLVRGTMETFDGKHPCEVCAKAEELRKNEGSGDPRNHPQEKNPVRFAWGEMVEATWLVMPMDSGTDYLTLSGVEAPWLPGRGMDAPVLPPPERA